MSMMDGNSGHRKIQIQYWVVWWSKSLVKRQISLAKYNFKDVETVLIELEL